MSNKFEIANWKQYIPKAILHGRSVVLPNEFTSRLLLLRWTRANNTPEAVGEIEAIIKSPFGTPATPRKTFQISNIADYYEFWNIANDGLPYNLSAKLQGNNRIGTQLTIWEYTPEIQFSSITETTINMFTAPSTPTPEYKSEFLSVPANIGAPMTLPPKPLRGGGGRVINNTNKILWVLESDLPIAPAKPAAQLAAGGNYDITEGYKGAVQTMIAPGGAPLAPGASVDFTEFVQIN